MRPLRWLRERLALAWSRAEGRTPPRRAARLALRAARWGARSAAFVALRPVDAISGRLLAPLVNAALVPLRRGAVRPGSVLHISWSVHVPWHMTRALRRHGVDADYLAIGPANWYWSDCDHRFDPRGPLRRWHEVWFFWAVVARYEVVHSHFAVSLTESGWELPVLRRLGRRVVVHYRGCEVRDEAVNRRLHPEVNICQQCDYGGRGCREAAARVRRAERWGDAFLVTTPDLRDFAPRAEHLPFFAPEVEPVPGPSSSQAGGPFKVVHVTNHPGIDGTAYVERAAAALRARGHRLELVVLKGLTWAQVVAAHRDADVSVGKLKMGFYANAQIEAMALGVPAVTWVRPDLLTPEVAASGLILTHPDDLERTLEHYLTHPEELLAKRRAARASILRLHDEADIARRLRRVYFPRG